MLLVEVLLEAVVGDLAVVDGWQRVNVLDLVRCNGVAISVVIDIRILVLLVLPGIGILLQPSKRQYLVRFNSVRFSFVVVSVVDPKTLNLNPKF